ncbi:uncharacterized protein LOC129587070 [Paramacrobiotus metropolitanus]|uniref:uncharacterized protein LOC129587070 n=1 Tax=Paramacrobiotus metropolitanus TaxID=2943436 RepID=UPI0024456E83|nr:uncharacterized protein LOC129587070 [Paramacrobiotus metropolitanus]
MPKACSDCDTLQHQLAHVLEQLNSVQAECKRFKEERDAYHDSCVASRMDVLKGNKLFFDQKQQITELKDKVALYQETNQMLFEKCAHANDLEDEVRQLRSRLSEVEKVLRPQSSPECMSTRQSSAQQMEPNFIGKYPSREITIKCLNEYNETLANAIKTIERGQELKSFPQKT